MADPFSIASGIVGVLGLTISITQIVVQFGLDWKDAPKEAKSIVSELQSLKVVMLEIEKAESNLLLNTDFVHAFQDRPSLLLSELGPNAPATSETRLSINVCKQELENLLDKLKKIGKGHRVGWERLKAPFLVKDLQKSIDKAHRQCRILNDMISYDAINLGVHTVGQVKRARKEQKQWHDAQKNQEILSWLSDLKFVQKQTDIFSKHYPGTGEWFLNLDLFKAWRDGHQDTSSTLWCPGIPGAGKSVMISIVIASLQEMFDKAEVSISYVYCDYKDRARQTTPNLLASLVKQLVMQHEDMPTEVINMYAEHSKRNSSPSLEEFSRVFPLLLHGFRRSFILVDALDEHFTSGNEESILEVSLLDELLKLQQTGPGYTLFITSRAIPMIQERLTDSVHIEIFAADADIELYLRSRIYDCSKFRFADKMRTDNDLADLVVGSLVKKARGMFLLPCLHLDRLSCQTNVRNLRKALKDLPTRLGETYSEAMTRIRGQVPEHSELALSALRWISHAIRPLRAEELQCVLAVQPGDQFLDPEALPDIALIVSVSAGLLTIDSKSQTIRLVHFTVEEYLRQVKHEYFPDADILIAETCITYLSFEVFGFDTLPIEEPEHDLAYMESLHVFFNYAAHNWGHHLRGDAEHALEGLATDFLTNDRNLVYPGQAYLETELQRYASQTLSPLDKVTGIYLMVYFGLTHILSIFLKNTRPLQIQNKRSRLLAPLPLAILAGRRKMVKLLLDRENIRADYQYDEMITPVHCAAMSGHKSILKLLLDREDMKADSPSSDRRTPLHFCITHGHKGIARLLLERDDVRSDSPDHKERTPLHYAIRYKRDTITKMLLERHDVKVNAPDYEKQTPLSFAASRGHETIAKLLLELKDVKADSPDGDGRTPLWHAARNGHESMTKILLARDDVTVDHLDQHGLTPLRAAALEGHTTTVRLLLECKDARPDLREEHGQRPLSSAIDFGHTDMARLLTEIDDVVINQVDRRSRTPLFRAVEKGHATIVKLLLERKDIKPNIEDKDGSTPLLVAAKDGNIEIVQLLIERDDVAINHRSGSDRIPLFWAAYCGHVTVVKLLLEHKDIKLDLQDKDGETPLSIATKKGYTEIARLLEEKMAIKEHKHDLTIGNNIADRIE